MLLSDLRSGICPMGDTSTTEDLAKSKQIGGRITGLNEKEYPTFENIGYIEGAVFWELSDEFISNGRASGGQGGVGGSEEEEEILPEDEPIKPGLIIGENFTISTPFDTVTGTGSFTEIPIPNTAQISNLFQKDIEKKFIFCEEEKPPTSPPPTTGSLSDPLPVTEVRIESGGDEILGVIPPARRSIRINIPGAPGQFLVRVNSVARVGEGGTSQIIEDVIDPGGLTLEELEGLEGVFNTKNTKIKAGRWIYGAHFCKYHAIRNKIFPVNQFGGYDLTYRGKTVFQKNTENSNTVMVPFGITLAHNGIGLCAAVPGTECQKLTYFQIPDYSLNGSFGGANAVTGTVLSPSNSTVGTNGDGSGEFAGALRGGDTGPIGGSFDREAFVSNPEARDISENELISLFPHLFPSDKREAIPGAEQRAAENQAKIDRDPRAGFSIAIEDTQSEVIYETFFEMNFQRMFRKYMSLAFGFGTTTKGSDILFDNRGRLTLKFKGCDLKEELPPEGEETEAPEPPEREISGGEVGDDDGDVELPIPPPPLDGPVGDGSEGQQSVGKLPDTLTVTQLFSGKHVSKRTSASVTMQKKSENSWSGEDASGIANLSGSPGNWSVSKIAKNNTGTFFRGRRFELSPIGEYPSFTRSASQGDMNGLFVG